MIPKGWSQSTVGEVFSFQRTVALSRAQLSVGAPCGYIHYGDIHTRWNTHLDLGLHELPSCDLELVASAARVVDGDLVLADASEDLDGVGKAVEIRNVGERAVVAGLHTVLMRPRPHTFAPGFAGYLTSMPEFVAQARTMAAGLKVFGLSKTALAKFTVFLPPLAEQQAIAEAISDADALVESLDALIAKKRDMKQAAMQQLLTGRTRLPGFTDEWRTVTLSDCADRIYGGGTPSRAEPGYWSGAIPWVTVKDLATHDKRMTQEYISTQGLLSSSAQLVPPGQVIVCTRMAPGKAVMFEVDVAINQDMKALITKSDVYPPFILCVINARADELATISSGSTVAGLSVADLRSLQLALPAIEEQQAIAAVLSDMDAEIDALVAQREKAELVKQGMMQELLSGRVRLA